MKRQKDRTLEDELSRSVGAQYATGDQWRNNSRKNEGPITSWQIDGETMETVTDFIFLDSKITADGDCSREIKRHSLEEKS